MDASTVRQAFDEAAQLFLDTVAKVTPEGLDAPGLGVWTVRDLIGHTARSFVTIETYVPQGADAVDVPSAAHYYAAVEATANDAASVAQRGRDAGQALGPDPVRGVQELAERVLALVHETPDDALTATAGGGMRFIDYLGTRVLELGVHTLDLARVVADEVVLPPAVAAVVLHLLADLANTPERSGPVILALTGRAPLPAGFSLV